MCVCVCVCVFIYTHLHTHTHTTHTHTHTHTHVYIQAENDAAQPPAHDLPQHWDATRVNKAIGNWQNEADSEDKTAWGTF